MIGMLNQAILTLSLQLQAVILSLPQQLMLNQQLRLKFLITEQLLLIIITMLQISLVMI